MPNPIEMKISRLSENIKVEDTSEGEKPSKQKGKRKGRAKKLEDPLKSNAILDSKPNSKNTYINKINTLIHDEVLPTKIVEE